jgi:hypothetical protein
MIGASGVGIQKGYIIEGISRNNKTSPKAGFVGSILR